MTVNLKQSNAFHDPSRFQFWLAGRRGGKTFGLTHRIQQKVHQSPDGGEIFYIGPTNQHSMELIWEPLERLFWESGWKYRALISKQRFELPMGRKVFVMVPKK